MLARKLQGAFKAEEVSYWPEDFTAASVTQTLDTSSQSNYSIGVFVSEDGSNLYVADYISSGNGQILQYSLSTAFDLSSASYVRAFDVSSEIDDVITDVTFKDDGTKMYVSELTTGANGGLGGTYNGRVWEYGLSSAWNISTASLNDSYVYAPDSYTQHESAWFSDSGTVMHTSITYRHRVYRHTLSTAWDVSTATVDSSAGTVSQPTGVALSPDGDYFLVVARDGKYLQKYSLTTANDYPDGTTTVDFIYDTAYGRMQGVCPSPDGKYIFIAYESNNIRKISY